MHIQEAGITVEIVEPSLIILPGDEARRDPGGNAVNGRGLFIDNNRPGRAAAGIAAKQVDGRGPRGRGPAEADQQGSGCDDDCARLHPWCSFIFFHCTVLIRIQNIVFRGQVH